MPEDMKGHAIRYRDSCGCRSPFKPNVEPAIFPKSKELASSIKATRMAGKRSNEGRRQMRKSRFPVLCVPQVNPRLGKVHIGKVRREAFG